MAKHGKKYLAPIPPDELTPGAMGKVVSLGKDPQAQKRDHSQAPEIMYDGEYFISKDKPEAGTAAFYKWIAEQDNLAVYMPKEARAFIGERVMRHLGIDRSEDFADWESGARRGLDLIDPTKKRVKSEASADGEPNPPSFPLLMQAVIQFSETTMESLLPDAFPVKVTSTTQNPDENTRKKAVAMSEGLSAQVMAIDPRWMVDTDRMLHHVAATGMAYRKRYHDAKTGKQLSEFLTGFEVIPSSDAGHLRDAARISHEFTEYPFEIRQLEASDYYFDTPLDTDRSSENPDKPIEFVEQHCWWDLDGDELEEPYIITVHKATNRVVRVVAGFSNHGFTLTDRGVIFERIEMFTSYGLIPNPNGSFFCLGFGHLLLAVNENVDDLLHTIIEGGRRATAQGGVIGRGGMAGGKEIEVNPDRFQEIDLDMGTLKDNLMFFPKNSVDPTLFSALELLVGAGQRLSSSVDLMKEGVAANMPATTTMAIIGQGMKIYSGIHRRMYWSMSDEFRILYDLNRAYSTGELSYSYAGKEGSIAPSSFSEQMDVRVHADPTLTSDAHRMAMAQFLQGFIGNPIINQELLHVRIFELMKVSGGEELIAPPQEGPPPEIMLELEKLKLDAEKADVVASESKMKGMLMMAQMRKLMADTAKALAEAVSVEANIGNDKTRLQLDAATKQIEVFLNTERLNMDAAMKADQNKMRQQGNGQQGPSAA